jgi:arylsulfatase A-like enzyme
VIAFWDMLPTFAELAGAPAPSHVDGLSIVNVLMGGSLDEPHEYFYWDYGHCRRRYDQAVRMKKMKRVTQQAWHRHSGRHTPRRQHSRPSLAKQPSLQISSGVSTREPSAGRS